MATYKLDIFELLGRIDSSGEDIFCKLTNDEKKAFAPLVVMRWMSGTSDEYQIIKLNEFVNPYVFSLGDHKHLLMQLLQAASSKSKKRYNWIALKTSKKHIESEKVISEYFEISRREAQFYSLEASEIIEMAQFLGWQNDDLNKLKKELNVK